MDREGIGGYSVPGTNIPDKLIAAYDILILTGGITLKSGQGILTRGSVIGIETATGKGILCDSASADGSQTAKYILAEDSIDTTNADVVATCYKTGIFQREALVFGANGAPATIDDDFRNVGMYLQGEVPY